MHKSEIQRSFKYLSCVLQHAASTKVLMEICLIAFWFLGIFPEPEDILERLIHKAKPKFFIHFMCRVQRKDPVKMLQSTNNTNLIKMKEKKRKYPRNKKPPEKHIIEFKPCKAGLWIQDWHNAFWIFSYTKMPFCIWKVFVIFAIITISLRCICFDLVNNKKERKNPKCFSIDV